MTYDPTCAGRERSERARRIAAEAECERLRGLLADARGALRIAKAGFSESVPPHEGKALAMDDALRRSDPDARAEIRQARGL